MKTLGNTVQLGIACLTTCAIATATSAEVQSPLHNGAQVQITNVGLDRWAVVITQQVSGTINVILEGNPTDRIASIYCKMLGTSGSQATALIIRGEGGVPGIASVEEIDGTVGNSVFLSTLDILGDFGVPGGADNSVTVRKIGSIHVGGDWYTTVRALPLFPSDTFTTGAIQVDGDWIGGHLWVNNGSISSVSIAGDMLPYGPSPVASEIWARDSIASVAAGSMIDTRIGDNTGGYSGKSDVDTIDCAGDFTSDFLMQLASVQRFAVGGNFDAEVDVLDGLGPSDMIRIGGTLAATGIIAMPTSGLAGQIIVNGADGSATWDGDIEVGAATLAPDYTQTHASLGGGAAGLVPFNLHGTDSKPLDAQSVEYMHVPGPSSPIEIRHYGPIAITGDGLSAITFDAKLSSQPDEDYVDRKGCLDAVAVGADNTVLLVTPTAPLLNGYTYRVMTVRTDPNNRVECDLGLSPNPLVADYTYEFCVGTETPADIDGDGTVGVFDFGIFAPNFDSAGCFVRGDMDGDNDVDVFDFGIFAPQFGLTGLGLCSAGSAAAATSGGGAMTELFQNLGFDGVADYCQWLGTLSKKEQIAAIVALFELAQEQK